MCERMSETEIRTSVISPYTAIFRGLQIVILGTGNRNSREIPETSSSNRLILSNRKPPNRLESSQRALRCASSSAATAALTRANTRSKVVHRRVASDGSQ